MSSQAPASSDPTRSTAPMPRTPVCLVLGMAGSGKTTLVDALSAWLEDEHVIKAASSASPSGVEEDNIEEAEPKGPTGAYVVNLDPAVKTLPYEPNVDIRDTLKYKDVMRDYKLGPNGAIITALNLYATRFDEVLKLVERRAPDVRAVLFDTPGQIETFTWSASGTIFTEALGMSLPTVVLFVVDTQRSASAMTFVSNMLYACSVMYKTGLPMVIVFNKIDVQNCKYAQSWMEDFDAFDAALKEDNFVGVLARSMAMALEEFYKNMRSVGVSAETGEGLPELVEAIKDAGKEYERDYRPALEERKRRRAEEEQEEREKQMEKLERHMKEEAGPKPGSASDEGSSPNNEPSDRNGHEVRIQKMKGEHVDEAQDKEDFENLVRSLEAVKTSDDGQ